jgi:hypothetical protein
MGTDPTLTERTVYIQIMIKEASNGGLTSLVEPRSSNLLKACPNSIYIHGQGSKTLTQCVDFTMHILVTHSRPSITTPLSMSTSFVSMALLRTKRTL